MKCPENKRPGESKCQFCVGGLCAKVSYSTRAALAMTSKEEPKCVVDAVRQAERSQTATEAAPG